jgi:hypothetical protein
MQIKSDVNDQVFGRLEKEPEHRIYHEVRHMRFHYYQMWCPLKDQDTCGTIGRESASHRYARVLQVKTHTLTLTSLYTHSRLRV